MCPGSPTKIEHQLKKPCQRRHGRRYGPIKTHVSYCGSPTGNYNKAKCSVQCVEKRSPGRVINSVSEGIESYVTESVCHWLSSQSRSTSGCSPSTCFSRIGPDHRLTTIRPGAFTGGGKRGRGLPIRAPECIIAHILAGRAAGANRYDSVFIYAMRTSCQERFATFPLRGITH